MKLSVVHAWHHALRCGDVTGLVALTSPDVVLGGPRGTTEGHDALRAWAGGAGVVLEPVRWFCGPHTEVVVAQHASWPDGGGGRTPPVGVSTRFSVRDGLIERIDRHDDLDTALAACGLATSDEVVSRS